MRVVVRESALKSVDVSASRKTVCSTKEASSSTSFFSCLFTIDLIKVLEYLAAQLQKLLFKNKHIYKVNSYSYIGN
jgi:hypothetical protein